MIGVLIAVAEPPAPAPPAAIVRYHDSGAWARDTTRVTDRARRLLADHLADPGKRPALVLDVDDTALSSYRCLRRAGFDRSAARCAERGHMPAIPQTRALYRFARGHGVAVFFVTRRREPLRAVTLANLRASGYRGRLRVRLAPAGDGPAAHRRFKARARRAIERRGYRIVVNLGDQRSDLTGGSALHGLKLPNPMYVTR